MTLTNLFQYVSFSSPILIVFFITLYSIVQYKILSGLIFNMGIVLISSIVYMLKHLLKNKQDSKASPFCNVLPSPFTIKTYDNINNTHYYYDSPSFSSSVLAFSATYLIYPMIIMNQQNVSWYFDDNLNGIQDKDWLGIAEIYVNDHKKSAPFHIYNDYNGLNLGYSSFGTRNGFYQGIDISLDNTTQVNPLRTGFRVSYFGVSFLKEYKGDNSEFLFYALQFRTFLHVNLVQFGLNKNSNLVTKTWFWKPEIGVNFGLLNIAYAYNLPFKNTGDLKGHQLKIAFSYPLVRLGKYQ